MSLGVFMIDESIVYRLADYPVLAQIAQKQTAAKKLDARACRYIYASNQVDVSSLAETEKTFFSALFNGFLD